MINKKKIIKIMSIFMISPKVGAFTLAEVLITLGIIGIVATMTIPTLMQKYYEHQTVARLLETTSILTQAIKLSEDEYGDVASWGLKSNTRAGAEEIFKRISPFLKISLDCGVDESCKCFANSYKLLNKKGSTSYKNEVYKYKIALMNGSSVILQPIFSGNMQINIDTNGPSKPNIMGKDLFIFQYNSETHSLLPMGASNTMFPYKTYCIDNNATGYGCAYYVLNFKNMDYLHKH